MTEAMALVATLECTPPGAPTACAGWTCHHLTAHLAAGAAEMADLVETSLSGGGERSTKAFGEREAPYLALADDDLRNRLFSEAIRLNLAVEQLRSLGSQRTVPFAGKRLTASQLDLHGRCEAAVHRWDLTGDDEVSSELLSAPELTVHAVSVLNEMLEGSREAVAARVPATGTGPFRASFAAPDVADVVLVVDHDGARLEMDDSSGPPTAVSDGATRLLALWGRRSSTHRITWCDDDPRSRRLAAFLWAGLD